MITITFSVFQVVAIVWIFLSILVGVIAKTTGRSFFAWFVLSIFFSPIFVGIFLYGDPQAEIKNKKNKS